MLNFSKPAGLDNAIKSNVLALLEGLHKQLEQISGGRGLLSAYFSRCGATIFNLQGLALSDYYVIF